MALQRNGYKKYKKKRNSNGKRKPVNGNAQSLVMYKGRLRELNKGQLKFLEQEDKRLVKWFKDLSNNNQFSREWILTCLTELALQCMGKTPHVVGDVHVLNFMPKTAVTALKNMAEIQGFNVFNINWKGGIIPFDGAIDKGNDKPKSIELKDNDDITAETVELLLEAGAFQSPATNVTDAEIIQ